MIAKLSRWVWPAAWTLAFVAGMINITGLLSFERQAVTHLTGTASALSNALASNQWSAFVRLFTVALSFVAGSAVSGFFIKDSTLRIRRSYALVLGLESLLLFAAIPLLQGHLHLGICLASAACGLQNAMATTYSGATIRTTHLSGMFTDLGIFLGHLAGRTPVDWRRLRLCCVVISGFLGGGVVGAWAVNSWGAFALILPASISTILCVWCAALTRKSWVP